MLLSCTAVLGLLMLLQAYPASGLPWPAAFTTKAASTAVTSTRPSVANKSLHIQLNHPDKPSIVININNNNGILGGSGGVSIGSIGIGGGSESCTDASGCIRGTTKSTTPKATTTTTTTTTAKTTTGAATITTARTAAPSTTKAPSGYLLITNLAVSNDIVLEPPTVGEARGVTTRRTTSTAEEGDLKTTVTKSAAGSTRPSASTTAKRKAVASAAGGCHTMVEHPDEADPITASPATMQSDLGDVCHVLVRPEEANEDSIAPRHAGKAAAIVDVRVVPEAAGCQVAVKPKGAAEEAHDDAKTRGGRVKSVDVKVVASAAGCNVEVRSETGTATHTALDTSATTPRPATRAQHLDIAVLPQPAGGCHVHVRTENGVHQDQEAQAPANRTSIKPIEVNVRVTPYRAGGGCRVELGGVTRPTTASTAARAPPNKAARVSATAARSTARPSASSAGKALATPSVRSAAPDADADDAVVPLDPDDIAERTGVLAALGQTIRAVKITMMNGAEATGGVVANVTRRVAKGLRIVMDIESTTAAAASTEAAAGDAR